VADPERIRDLVDRQPTEETQFHNLCLLQVESRQTLKRFMNCQDIYVTRASHLVGVSQAHGRAAVPALDSPPLSRVFDQDLSH
jgi:hypothetical protein